MISQILGEELEFGDVLKVGEYDILLSDDIDDVSPEWPVDVNNDLFSDPRTVRVPSGDHLMLLDLNFRALTYKTTIVRLKLMWLEGERMGHQDVSLETWFVWKRLELENYKLAGIIERARLSINIEM